MWTAADLGRHLDTRHHTPWTGCLSNTYISDNLLMSTSAEPNSSCVNSSHTLTTQILAKVLAGRLENILPYCIFIHPDQTGFISGRQISSNLRLFNVIYQRNNWVPEVVISLDAQEDIDRIEYNFLFKALEKFGFGPVFRTWIAVIYAASQALVRTNKVISNFFPLRGTRQGCPLSPLLFDIAIEPLVIRMRELA